MVARDKAIRVDAVCLSDLRDPLFFRISPGLFNASLYDHLNVMLLHVNKQSAAWTARMGILIRLSSFSLIHPIVTLDSRSDY
jgi:hypothetical protein